MLEVVTLINLSSYVIEGYNQVAFLLESLPIIWPYEFAAVVGAYIFIGSSYNRVMPLGFVTESHPGAPGRSKRPHLHLICMEICIRLHSSAPCNFQVKMSLSLLWSLLVLDFIFPAPLPRLPPKPQTFKPGLGEENRFELWFCCWFTCDFPPQAMSVPLLWELPMGAAL